jgi:hypothetical protein
MAEVKLKQNDLSRPRLDQGNRYRLGDSVSRSRPVSLLKWTDTGNKGQTGGNEAWRAPEPQRDGRAVQLPVADAGGAPGQCRYR